MQTKIHPQPKEWQCERKEAGKPLQLDAPHADQAVLLPTRNADVRPSDAPLTPVPESLRPHIPGHHRQATPTPT